MEITNNERRKKVKGGFIYWFFRAIVHCDADLDFPPHLERSMYQVALFVRILKADWSLLTLFAVLVTGIPVAVVFLLLGLFQCIGI